MTKIPEEVNIRGILYRVTTIEDAIIFGEAIPVWGHKKIIKIIVRAGCWYIDTTENPGSYMLAHIQKMYELCQEWYGKDHYISPEMDREIRERLREQGKLP